MEHLVNDLLAFYSSMRLISLGKSDSSSIRCCWGMVAAKYQTSDESPTGRCRISSYTYFHIDDRTFEVASMALSYLA
jgi:hypothetical protein